MTGWRTGPIGRLGGLVLLGCIACAPPPEDAGGAAPAAKKEAPPAIRVLTLTLAYAPFQETFEATGTVAAWRAVTVSSELGGLVRELRFDKGERVRRGQVLARVGDDLIQAQLAQSRADLEGAEVEFEKAQLLFQRQAIPEQQFLTAKARRDRAAARVREMEIRLERAVIRAPISGLARDRFVEVGEVIAPGTPITEILDVDRVKIETALPDTELGWVRLGVPAQVNVDAFPGRSFKAEVTYVAPAADSVSRTFAVECALDNPEMQLRPGMVARVRLIRRDLDRALVLPQDALVQGPDGTFVFLERECKAVRAEVRILAREGDRVLVDGPLHPGDAVVIEGQRQLRQGLALRTERCP